MRLVDPDRYAALKATGKLPSPKGVALSIIRLLQRDDFRIGDLVRLVQSDPAIAGRILYFANAAAFGRSRPIGGLRARVHPIGGGEQGIEGFVISSSGSAQAAGARYRLAGTLGKLCRSGRGSARRSGRLGRAARGRVTIRHGPGARPASLRQRTRGDAAIRCGRNRRAVCHLWATGGDSFRAAATRPRKSRKRIKRSRTAFDELPSRVLRLGISASGHAGPSGTACGERMGEGRGR